jgi:hypothetical protein
MTWLKTESMWISGEKAPDFGGQVRCEWQEELTP